MFSTRTRTRFLRTATVAAAVVGATVGVTAGPASAAATRCGNTAGGDCISAATVGKVTPFRIPVTVKTTIPTKVTLTATPTNGGAVRTVSSTTFATSRTLTVADLQLATGYTVEVKATGGAGNSHTEKLAVRTKNTRITAAIDDIAVGRTGDADYAPGELYVHAGLNFRTPKRLYADYSAKWGTHLSPGWSETQYGTEAALLQVQVIDDDCVLFCAGVRDVPPFTAPLVEPTGMFTEYATNSDYDLGGARDSSISARYQGEGRWTGVALTKHTVVPNGPVFTVFYHVDIAYV